MHAEGVMRQHTTKKDSPRRFSRMLLSSSSPRRVLRRCLTVGNRRERTVFQEPRKGGFSKGGFRRSWCHTQEDKSNPRMWAQQYVWHSESHSRKGASHCKNPLLKPPFSWFLSFPGHKNFMLYSFLLQSTGSP